MAVIFSALGIILLLSTVIVNALEVHEDNQELLKLRNMWYGFWYFYVDFLTQKTSFQKCSLKFVWNMSMQEENLSVSLQHWYVDRHFDRIKLSMGNGLVTKNCFFTASQLSLFLNDLFSFQNPYCQSNGMFIHISSSVQFPNLMITDDWLNGSFKLKEMYIDLENVFVIYENAFAGEVFKRMQKLVFNNLHLPTMETVLLRKLQQTFHEL